MSEKEVSDKELDAMIDASIKQGKAEKQKKTESTPKEKKAAPAKEAKAPTTKSSDGSAVSPKAQKAETKKAKTDKPAALKVVEGYDPWRVLSYPHLTEKSMNLVERNNVLVFVVDMDATKQKIKEAVEKGLGVRVVSVRVEITRKNHKKAYVRLAEGVLASDIATRLGMI
jgi:large subunit ribosomal protein L23